MLRRAPAPYPLRRVLRNCDWHDEGASASERLARTARSPHSPCVRFTRFLSDEAATQALGARLAPVLSVGDVVALSGPLGAGKTALARGLIAALTGEDEAPSPTFPLVLVYDGPAFPLWHFDLYRVERTEEIEELGWSAALDSGASLVEWPDRLGDLLPAGALRIALAVEGAGRRAAFDADAAWTARLAAAGIMEDS